MEKEVSFDSIINFCKTYFFNDIFVFNNCTNNKFNTLEAIKIIFFTLLFKHVQVSQMYGNPLVLSSIFLLQPTK